VRIASYICEAAPSVVWRRLDLKRTHILTTSLASSSFGTLAPRESRSIDSAVMPIQRDSRDVVVVQIDVDVLALRGDRGEY
jgi:hypothetical protein